MMNHHLIIELAKRDFIERYSGSILGFIWSFINPLITIVVYMIVFGNLMGARLPGDSSVNSYVIYLVSGIIPWLAFSNTVSRASTVLIDKKYLISKIHIDLPSLPLFLVLSETITFMATLGIFLSLLLVTGYSFTLYLLLIPVIYCIQQVFAYALGFFLSMFVVFIRDLKEIVNIGFFIWFWFTPIVYVFEILPPQVQDILMWNPANAFISAYHAIFIYREMPSWIYLILLLCFALLLIVVNSAIFKKLEKDIRDFI